MYNLDFFSYEGMLCVLVRIVSLKAILMSPHNIPVSI